MFVEYLKILKKFSNTLQFLSHPLMFNNISDPLSTFPYYDYLIGFRYL